MVRSQLKNRSLFNPSVHSNEHVEVFNQMVLHELEKLKINKMKDPQENKLGIKQLEERKNVVIRPADNGGGGGYCGSLKRVLKE